VHGDAADSVASMLQGFSLASFDTCPTTGYPIISQTAHVMGIQCRVQNLARIAGTSLGQRRASFAGNGENSTSMILVSHVKNHGNRNERNQNDGGDSDDDREC
jgi:hypothetical protein